MRYYIDFFKARDELCAFNLWLKKLKHDSIERYKASVIGEENYFRLLDDVNHIGSVANYIRDYVYGLIELGYIESEEINKILSKIQQIIAIEPIRAEDSKVFGICSGNVLYINPEIKGSETLSPEERTRLYVCKELTEFLYDHWQEDVNLYLDDVISSRKKSGDYPGTVFVRGGFDLLKNVVSQDVAENIAYLFANKSRPEKKVFSDELLYGGDYYRTNLDCCGAVEDVVVNFSKTIKDVASGTYDEREILLRQLARDGFSGNFIDSMICQFDGSLEEKHDFYDMFLSMGKIYDAYRIRETGVGNSDELYFSSCYRDSLENLCSKYSDNSARTTKKKNLVLVAVSEDIE